MSSDMDLLRSHKSGDRMAKASESSLRRSMLLIREVSRDLGSGVCSHHSPETAGE